MNIPRIGSVCTGYGGLDDAVRQVFGGELAWVSDIDPGACQIITHRMPGVPNIGDLTTADWTTVEPVDIYIGGYPCQPFSLAGLRKGTSDERHIWPYIADSLRVLRPRVAIFENVAGHLRLGFDTVLADLARLGFDAQWCLVRASEVGAPHPRKRLFIYATAQDSDRAARGERRVAAPGQAQGRRARADAGRRGGAPAPDADGDTVRQQPVSEPGRRSPAITELSSPHAAAYANRRGLTGNPERHCGPNQGQPERQSGLDADRCGVQRAVAPDADGCGQRTDQRDVQPRQPDAAWGRFLPAVRRWEAVTGHPAPRATDDRRRLSPAFVEWMMGLPAGHVTDVPDLTRTQQLKALGNGVVPQQAAAAIRLLADRAGVAA